MKLITGYDLLNREQKKLPTLIIDARLEDECRTFEMINPFTMMYLNEKTYGGKRIMPSELNAYLDKLKTWQTANPTALIAVGCTRMVRYCSRISDIVTVLERNGIDARGIDPHIIDFMNVRFQRKLEKVMF